MLPDEETQYCVLVYRSVKMGIEVFWFKNIFLIDAYLSFN